MWPLVVLCVLFVIIVSVGIYTTWITYATVSDNDARISKLNAAQHSVISDLRQISTDVNYNDKILEDEERNTRELINQNQTDSETLISTIETNIRHDFESIASSYADAVESRGAASLASSSMHIYDTIAASNSSLLEGITNTRELADANLNTRISTITNTINNNFMRNSNVLEEYRRTNNSALGTTNANISAHSLEIGALQSQFITLTDFSNVTKNRLGNMESWRTSMTTSGGTIDTLKTDMLNNMDEKDRAILAHITAQGVNTAVSTGNISSALIGFSNQMSNINVNISNAVSSLNTQSSLDNAMRSNLFVDNATGNIGMGGRKGVFSSTRLPLADLEINNGGSGSARMRLTGTTGAAIELNGAGSMWKLDSSGNMSMDADPTGSLTLQGISKGPLVIGSRNSANSTYLQNYKLFVNGALGVANSNVLELGVGVADKDPSAGKVTYDTSDNTLRITGAGTTAGTRKIALDGDGGVSVAGSLNVAVNKKVCVGATCISEEDLLSFKSWTPIGIITMWSGTTAPAGWGLCNGTTYTRSDGAGTIVSPDLRGRFVVGQGQGSGLTNRPLNEVGGRETQTMTIAQMPSHNHGINDPGHYHAYFADDVAPYRWQNNGYDASSGRGTGGWTGTAPPGSFGSDGYTGITIQSTGGGQPISVVPPYYSLAYIIKI